MERLRMRHVNRRLRRVTQMQSTNEVNTPLVELLKNTLAIIQHHQLNYQSDSVKHSNNNNNGSNKQGDQFKTNLDRQQTRTSLHLSIDKWKISKDLIPNYSTFPSHIFKNILCKSIPHYRQHLEHYLTNSQLLSFIQQYTHIFCIHYQLEMEKDYWKYIDEKLLCTMNWLRKMPKDLTKRYLIDWNYPRTEQNLRHRQQLTDNKINNTIQELELHFQQYASFFMESNSIFMPQILSMILEAVITVLKIGLQKLETNFSQNKLLMKYDATNIELLKSFYDLHPTEQEKLIFQKLWRVQYKSNRKIIRKENISSSDINDISECNIPVMSNQNINITAGNIHQLDISYLHSRLNIHIRHIIEAHHENTIRRANQILQFKNSSLS